MNSRSAVLRRVTIYVAALALVSASIVFGSSGANARTESTTPWRQAIVALAVPGQGCFTATSPSVTWRSTACSSVHPKIPQQFAGAKPSQDVAGTKRNPDFAGTEPSQDDMGGTVQEVGGCSLTCDYAAETTNPMTSAVGSFPSVTCASSPCESGTFGGLGAPGPSIYSLQLNTNYNLPATASCSTAAIPAGCSGWQQFVYDSDLKEIQIEPALIGYNNPCVAPFSASDGFGDCYDETESAVTVPQLSPQQLNSDAVTFTGEVGLVGGILTDTVVMVVSGTSYAATAPDSLVNLSGNWKIAQFGLYGDRGGTEANFIAGTDMKVNLVTHSGTTAAPMCIAWDSTGETNNLYLQPAPALAAGAAPAIESDQNSTAPSSPAGCATGNGWGEIHLNTFGCATCTTHLTYNFQATGDFQLADAPSPAGGTPFDVQTRLIPFAANTSLSVSQDVAAQVGSSQVAICGPQSTRVEVNDRTVALASGHQISLAGGGSVSLQGSTYLIQDAEGNTVQVELDSYLGVPYLDTWVGLGSWPTAVSGLLANGGGLYDAVASASGTVLTAPFQFSEFYSQYGDSWRVPSSQDLLSACSTTFTSTDPTVNYEASSLPTTEFQSAQATCDTAGVKVPALLDACILDVAVLGEGALSVYQALPTNLTWGQFISG
jgi:hypothetical protein